MASALPSPLIIKTTPTSGFHRCGCFGICGWGCFGVGSNEWTEKKPRNHFLKKIILSYNKSIRSIQMVYSLNPPSPNPPSPNPPSNEPTEPPPSKKYGGYGRHWTEIVLDKTEYITGISGRLSFWSKTLKSITFHTNRGEKYKRGPYGKYRRGDYDFSYHSATGIHSFYGNYNNTRILSIGFEALQN